MRWVVSCVVVATVASIINITTPSRQHIISPDDASLAPITVSLQPTCLHAKNHGREGKASSVPGNNVIPIITLFIKPEALGSFVWHWEGNDLSELENQFLAIQGLKKGSERSKSLTA